MPISHGGYRPPDPPPGGGFAPTNPNVTDLVAAQPDGGDTANSVPLEGNIDNVAEAESSDKIPISLSFELAEIDSIDDSFKYDKFGRYIGAVQNLKYREFGARGSTDPTYSYCPEERLNLQVEKIILPNDKELLLYTVQVPLSSDIAGYEQEFFGLYQTYASVRNICVFIVEVSQIPRSKVDSAINNLPTIKSILEFNFEDKESN